MSGALRSSQVASQGQEAEPKADPRARAQAPTVGNQARLRRIQGSVASVSWIDPHSPAGKHVLDPKPPATVTREFLIGSSGFRFTNFLEAWVESADSKTITSFGLAPASGLHRGPSYWGIASQAYPTQHTTKRFSENGVEGVTLEQACGARTISPAVIGATVGAGVGVLGGAAAGASMGAIAGLPGAAVGAVVGGIAGYMAGSAAANRIMNFPPIWTTLRLHLRADGVRRCEPVKVSWFPSASVYCDLNRRMDYSALAASQTLWEDKGWDAGNPWGAARPLIGVGDAKPAKPAGQGFGGFGGGSAGGGGSGGTW